MPKPKKDSRDAFIESLRPAKNAAPSKKREPKVGEVEVERVRPAMKDFMAKEKNKGGKELKPGVFKKKSK